MQTAHASSNSKPDRQPHGESVSPEMSATPGATSGGGGFAFSHFDRVGRDDLSVRGHHRDQSDKVDSSNRTSTTQGDSTPPVSSGSSGANARVEGLNSDPTANRTRGHSKQAPFSTGKNIRTTNSYAARYALLVEARKNQEPTHTDNLTRRLHGMQLQ